jgi:hypothetical protein
LQLCERAHYRETITNLESRTQSVAIYSVSTAVNPTSPTDGDANFWKVTGHI